jgi:hypothetical protein
MDKIFFEKTFSEKRTDDNAKQIRVKNDSKRVKSLFKYGLEFIAYAE